MSTVDFIKKKEDYRSETQELVLDQFKGSSNYNKIVNILSEVMEEWESVIVDAAEAMLFGNAVGEQLNEIGRQMGVPRTTEDDDEYRSIIALFTLKRRNTGTRDSLHDILTTSVADEVEFSLNAGGLVNIYLYGSCIQDESGIKAITDLLPINTYYRIVKSIRPSFGFSDSDEGYGNVNEPSSGGRLSSLLTSI